MYKREDGLVELSHDPFGRFSVIRRKTEDGTCYECLERGRRFQYGSEGDQNSNRPEFARGKFCSVGCFRAYYL